jgi:endonuclease YncB( thermonuclease family)
VTTRRLAAAIVACALAFAHLPRAGAGEPAGRVLEVADGDTLTILGADGQRHIVRLADIDAPEPAQRFGAASRRSLAALCGGKTAQVENRGLDREGRALGWVSCAGINANGEQVRRGMAWVDAPHVHPSSALYTLQADARLARRGLWRDRRPVAPWVWRARGRP